MGSQHSRGWEIPALLVGGGFFGVLGLLWLATSVAALAFGDGWPSLGADDVVRALFGLPGELGDPAKALPRETRRELAGPVGFYAVLAPLLAIVGALAYGGLRIARWSGAPTLRRSATSARWAGWRDLRPLRVRRAEPGRVVLGTTRFGLIAAEPRQSVLVVAPPQTGKTTGLAIPAMLEWEGPVIATSVKSDLLRDTLARRRQLGRVSVFDPTAATGIDSDGWSPLGSCGSWYGAQRMASWLCAAASGESNGLADANFWNQAAAKLLAPLLFAASTSGATMADVVRWIDTQEEAEVDRALAAAGVEEALAAAQASWAREERQRSSIYTTAENVLAAYADPRVMEALRRPEISPAELLDGGANTLYLCGPAHEQRQHAPLFGALLEEMVAAIYDAHSASGGPLDPPLLIVGDELANIAPIRSLPQIASTGAGQGIQLVSIFQDLAQVAEVWGPRASRTIVNNHRAKLFGTGIGDPETLRYVRDLTGEAEYAHRSESSSHHHGRSTTQGTTWRSLTPAHAVREAAHGSAVLIYGNLPPARLRLCPWFEDSSLSDLVKT
jgi:type IV secretion system protein VirD4